MGKNDYNKNNFKQTYTQLSLDFSNQEYDKPVVKNIVDLNEKRKQKEEKKEKDLERKIIQSAIDFSRSLDW